MFFLALPNPMIIYLVTNAVNGKKYVGQTKQSLAQRKAKHFNKTKVGCKVAFHCALRKYGASSFTWTQIAELPVTQINEAEQLFIKELNTMVPSGYNRTEGGAGVPGGCWKMPASFGQTASARMRGRKLSPEWVANIAAAHRGKKRSPQAREAMSKAHRGKKLSPEHCRSLSLARKGKPRPDMVGRKASAETKQKMSISAQGPCPARAAGVKAWWEKRKAASNSCT